MTRAHRFTILLFSFLAFACGKSDDAARGGEASASGAPGRPGVAQAATGAAASELDRIFDPELRKKACDILTPAMVGEILDVPEGELEQVKVMGCQYRWNSDTETAWASLISLQAHKDVPTAKLWFENSTKGMSKADVAKAMGDVEKKLDDDGELDTEPKKRAANMVGGALVAGAGEDGFQYEKLDGIGDEAAVGLSDGKVRVRVGNLVFAVSGYKGPKKPPSKVKPDPKNIKAYTAKIMEAERDWVKATLEQREAYAKKVAAAVTAKL